MDGDGECGFESEKVDRVVPCRWRDQNVFFNPKGCERVAGGRSEAKTSGSGMIGLHPERVSAFALEQHLAAFQGAEDQSDSGSGGLRPPATILQPFGLSLHNQDFCETSSSLCAPSLKGSSVKDP